MYKNKLEVLICTIDENINQVRTLLLPQLQDVMVLISHQITKEEYRDHKKWPAHVRYITLLGSGLSANRNNALQHARGDIVILADDDIAYVPNFSHIILDAYAAYPDATAITFQARNDQRWSESFAHNWRTVGQVASWMITFRLSSVREKGVVFDEDFGLGARYPQGEENIFLADLRQAGCTLIASPVVIVAHSNTSSGYIFTPEIVTAKIAVVRRMYGWFAALSALFIFSVTKYHLYRGQMSWFRFCYLGGRAL